MCLIFASIISCKDNPADTGGPIDPVTPGYHNPFNDNFPVWSPDGLKILYQHWGLKFIIYDEKYLHYYDYGNRDSMGLWIMNPDGSDPHMMLNGQFSSYDWSPDCSWIAIFIEGRIWKIPYNNGVLDESNISLLVQEMGTTFPRFSPDGEWIIYYKWINDEYGKDGLWIMRNDGSERRHFGKGSNPSWHPDGDKVIATRWQNGTKFYFILFYPFEDKKPDTLKIDFKEILNNPLYSPDGSKILFVHDIYGQKHLCLVNSDGSNPFMLTDGTDPSWSPDGTEIVFVRDLPDPRDTGSIWIINVNGENLRQLTRGKVINKK